MEERLIKHATAKLAKEKGIDISQFSNKVILKNGYVCDKLNSCINDEHEPYYTCTQSLLQKYFRENYNLHCSVYRHNHKWVSQLFDTERGCYITKWLGNPKEEYEQALESALHRCLDYIQ